MKDPLEHSAQQTEAESLGASPLTFLSQPGTDDDSRERVACV